MTTDVIRIPRALEDQYMEKICRIIPAEVIEEWKEKGEIVIEGEEDEN